MPAPRPELDSHSLYAECAWDYRPFLKHAIEGLRAASPRKLSYAALARLCGFKSKSFLQHVLAGERHLSLASAERVAEAIRLRDRDRSLFLSLVRLCSLEASVGSSPEKAVRLRKRIRRAREKSAARFERIPDRERKRAVYSTTDAALVYSALGRADRGATLAEAASRTRLPEASVKTALGDLVATGMIEARGTFEATRYFAALPFVYEESAEGREFVQRLHADLTREALGKAAADFANADRHFSAYALSVEAGRLPELGDRLKKLLGEFVLESEVPDGDHVARLSVSFF